MGVSIYVSFSFIFHFNSLSSDFVLKFDFFYKTHADAGASVFSYYNFRFK